MIVDLRDGQELCPESQARALMCGAKPGTKERLRRKLRGFLESYESLRAAMAQALIERETDGLDEAVLERINVKKEKPEKRSQ